MSKMRTRQEVEQLKNDWAKDPCWDLEDTEGFEAHRDELAEHRREMEAKWEKEIRAEVRRSRFRLIAYIGRHTSLGPAVIAMGKDDLQILRDEVAKIIAAENTP